VASLTAPPTPALASYVVPPGRMEPSYDAMSPILLGKAIGAVPVTRNRNSSRRASATSAQAGQVRQAAEAGDADAMW
jgi:hypothetical protein